MKKIFGRKTRSSMNASSHPCLGGLRKTHFLMFLYYSRDLTLGSKIGLSMQEGRAMVHTKILSLWDSRGFLPSSPVPSLALGNWPQVESCFLFLFFSPRRICGQRLIWLRWSGKEVQPINCLQLLYLSLSGNREAVLNHPQDGLCN